MRTREHGQACLQGISDGFVKKKEMELSCLRSLRDCLGGKKGNSLLAIGISIGRLVIHVALDCSKRGSLHPFIFVSAVSFGMLCGLYIVGTTTAIAVTAAVGMYVCIQSACIHRQWLY